MKKIKITSNLVLIKGIFMVLLGLFHICAILFIFDDSKYKTQMPPVLYTEFVLWFVVGGVYFIFIGVIDIIAYRGLTKMMHWAWQTAFTACAFAFICSIVGIIVFREGPPFLIFVLGLMALIPLTIFRKEFKG
jgi:hypothetical protein